MNTYTVTSVTEIAPRTALLTISPKTEADRLAFYPGQYASIGFKVLGRPTPVRSFSIVAAPTEGDALQFAFRVQGRFTTALSRLQTGDDVYVQGPFGEFAIDPNYDRSAVLFAAGIGITPFISMLRHADATHSPMPMTLIYLCRSFADIPFYDELRAIEARNPQVEMYYFISDGRIPADAGPRIIAGRPPAAVFDRFTSGGYQDSTYFVCGPKGMMQAVESQLADCGVDADHIMTESFTQTAPFWSKLSPARLAYALTAAALVVATGVIMSLDVSKKVAETNASNVTATNSSAATTTSNNSTTAATSDTSSTSNNSSGASSSSSTSSNTASQTQSPMSSVS
jgi:ferredoxin-NADP reductase